MKSTYGTDQNNAMFINNLKKNENSFVHERYSFGMKPGRLHQFAMCFYTYIYTYTKYISEIFEINTFSITNFTIQLSFYYHKQLSRYSPSSLFSLLFIIPFHIFLQSYPSEKPRQPFGSGVILCLDTWYLGIPFNIINTQCLSQFRFASFRSGIRPIDSAPDVLM